MRVVPRSVIIHPECSDYLTARGASVVTGSESLGGLALKIQRQTTPGHQVGTETEAGMVGRDLPSVQQPIVSLASP
jgi:hypothetical protein